MCVGNEIKAFNLKCERNKPAPYSVNNNNNNNNNNNSNNNNKNKIFPCSLSTTYIFHYSNIKES